MKKEKFKDLTVSEMIEKRKELKKELFNHKTQMVMGHIESPIKKRTLRRSIARLNFEIKRKGEEAVN